MSDTGTAPLARLRSLVGTFSPALLGYSGGVDSACVAVVLRQELGRDRMLAVIGRSASYPVAQWEAARRIAGVQAGIRSPLAEAGMTKADVRATARDLGLPVWDAPATPCLSSRVAYGLAITPSRLRQVETAEAYLRELGVTGDLRVRHHGDL